MTRRHRQLLATLAVAAAGGAALGCGGSEEPEGEDLPRATVSELVRRLDEIERRYNDARENDNPGACKDIETDSFRRGIDVILRDLPNDVDPDLRDAVNDSFSRLRELTSDSCAGVEPPETDTAPPETEIETVPPPEPPPETQTTPPPETDTAPPGDENQNGNGNGRGNGGTPPGQGGGGAPAPQNGGGD